MGLSIQTHEDCVRTLQEQTGWNLEYCRNVTQSLIRTQTLRPPRNGIRTSKHANSIPVLEEHLKTHGFSSSQLRYSILICALTPELKYAIEHGYLPSNQAIKIQAEFNANQIRTPKPTGARQPISGQSKTSKRQLHKQRLTTEREHKYIIAKAFLKHFEWPLHYGIATVRNAYRATRYKLKRPMNVTVYTGVRPQIQTYCEDHDLSAKSLLNALEHLRKQTKNQSAEP